MRRLRIGAAIVLVLLALYSAAPPGVRFWKRVFADCGFTASAGGAGPAFVEMHAIDVGKADAILLGSRGHWALLDAGTGVEADKVVDYLIRLGVTRLEYLIASHPDSDHIGGIIQVMEEIPTGAFLRGEGWEDAGQEAEDLLAYLSDSGVPAYTLHAGETFSLGYAEIKALGPLHVYPDANNNSLVLKLTCFQFSALFCGDVEKEAERDLVESGQNLSAHLLKVPHHGSRTSTTEGFLRAVSPQLAVVPVGPDSSGLPRPEILERLENMGVQVLRTDLDGNLIVSYDGERIGIRTGT